MPLMTNPLVWLMALAAPLVLTTPTDALAQTPPADESGQYVPLHPLAPASSSDVNILPDVPVVHTQADIAYVSGGIGGGERAALRATAPNYNLHLLFALEGSGAYLSHVRVMVRNQRGHIVLSATSDGPYFMAKLPPGPYRVTVVDASNSAQTRRVDVPAHGAAPASFFWRTES